MTSILASTQSIEVTGPCRCKAHTQHRVFRAKWQNPASTYGQIANDLHLSHSNVKKAMERLRRKDLSRRCPECFSPRLLRGVCENCGCEASLAQVPLEVNFEQQSPSNSLHPGNELGSLVGKTGYEQAGLGFTNTARIVKRWIDVSIEDPLTRGVKSDVMNELKEYYPAAIITDFAGKLCIKEVAEFRARYPILSASQNVRKQLAQNVMKRMKFLYPSLGRANRKDDDRVTPP